MELISLDDIVRREKTHIKSGRKTSSALQDGGDGKRK